MPRVLTMIVDFFFNITLQRRSSCKIIPNVNSYSNKFKYVVEMRIKVCQINEIKLANAWRLIE